MINTKLSVSLRILQLGTFQRTLTLKSKEGEMATVKGVISRVWQIVAHRAGSGP